MLVHNLWAVGGRHLANDCFSIFLPAPSPLLLSAVTVEMDCDTLYGFALFCQINEVSFSQF